MPEASQQGGQAKRVRLLGMELGGPAALGDAIAPLSRASVGEASAANRQRTFPAPRG